MSIGYNAVAAGRKLPMESIGTEIPGEMSAAEALQVAGLDWKVDLLPIYTVPVVRQETRLNGYGQPETVRVPIPEGEARLVKSDTQVAVVKDSDQAWLGTVGKGSYTPLQNEDGFAWLDDFRHEGRAHIDLAFQARGGAVVGMNARLPQPIMVGGIDAVDVNLLVINSHDGSKAFTAAVTPVRLACMNMLNAAIKGAHQSWKIRHTASAPNRLLEARRSLELTFKYVETFEKRSDRLIHELFNVDQFKKLAAELYPSTESDDNAARVQNSLVSNLLHSTTITDDFRFTRWGALQAVTEYLNWQRPRRSSKTRDSNEIWAESLMFGSVQELTSKTFQLLDA